MAFPKLTKIVSDNRLFNQLQDQLKTFTDAVSNKPHLDSIILPNISLKTGDNLVPHKLGRNLDGWKLIRKRGAADIYDTQDSAQFPNLYLYLHSSADVSVDLEVH